MKADKPDKPGQVPPAKSKKKPTEAEVLSAMEQLAVNNHEITSRLISDKLGLEADYGRSQIRRMMKKLAADGKVEIAVKERGKRKEYVYRLKEMI